MKYRWDKKYLYWGVTAFAVIACSIALFWLFEKWPQIKADLRIVWKILAPIIIGMVIAYLLNPVLIFFEKRLLLPLGKKLFHGKPHAAFVFARTVGIVISLGLFIFALVVLLWMVLPQLFSSIEGIVNNANDYINTVVNWVNNLLSGHPKLEKTAADMLSNLLSKVTGWLEGSLLTTINTMLLNLTTGVYNIVRGIFNFSVGLVVSAYLLASKETFAAQSKKMLYALFKAPRVNAFLDTLRLTHKTFSGFIYGKLLDSLIVGIINLVVMSILNIPFALLISVIVAVTNIIPIFGPLIGIIPSAFLILLVSPTKSLIFIIFSIVLQQLDGNILVPKILGNTTGLPSFWVMFSILVGGGLFGFTGMLCGVPVFAVLYSLARSFLTRRLARKALPTNTKEYELIDCIDDNGQPLYHDLPQ